MAQSDKSAQNPSHFQGNPEQRSSESWDDLNYKKEIKGWHFFDPHIHMVSRTTDDYQALADAGVVGIIEPAFWVGQPRTAVPRAIGGYLSLI